ncbi:MAG: hypothetical protein IJU71_07140 [Selenomonadaceae bacterium]|nr:hypothetical protein [Selenomonadaceae bacterium]
MSDVVENYRAVKFLIEYEVYTNGDLDVPTLGELLDDLFKIVKDKPHSYEYAFWAVECAELSAHDYVRAKELCAEAVEILSDMRSDQAEVEELLFRALKALDDACERLELDDLSGVDRLVIKKRYYEMSRRRDVDKKTRLLAAADYAETLRSIDLSSARECILNECRDLSEDTDINVVCRLKEVLRRCGEDEAARNMLNVFGRIVLNDIEAALNYYEAHQYDFADVECRNKRKERKERKRQLILARDRRERIIEDIDEAIAKLRALEFDDEVAKLEARREQIKRSSLSIVDPKKSSLS